MLEVIIVAGARPNFVKIAPLIHSLLKEDQIKYTLVHTGQHVHSLMNDVFFEDLSIPAPNVHLNISQGSQTQQTAEIMIRFEELLKNHPAQAVIVVGDVTSTMACSIVTKKYHKTLIHIESGLRSGDRNMPEEINRIITDSITDYFFTTSLHANANLLKEGIDQNRIFFVGNIMIDSLIQQSQRIQKPDIYTALGLTEKEYYLLTLHRAENVDDVKRLADIIQTISETADKRTCVFPVHPRTEKILKNSSSLNKLNNIKYIEPLRYHEFLYLQKNARAVITDSGGIQEETTFMNVPCITYRTTTERPETIETGSNELAKDLSSLIELLKKAENTDWKKSTVPDLWDGYTADRIVQKLKVIYSL